LARRQASFSTPPAGRSPISLSTPGYSSSSLSPSSRAPHEKQRREDRHAYKDLRFVGFVLRCIDRRICPSLARQIEQAACFHLKRRAGFFDSPGQLCEPGWKDGCLAG